MFFTSARNADRRLSTGATDIDLVRARITLTSMAFAQTFVIATVQRFPTKILARRTISIAALKKNDDVQFFLFVERTNLSFARMFSTRPHSRTFRFAEKFLATRNGFLFGSATASLRHHLSTLKTPLFSLLLSKSVPSSLTDSQSPK